MEKVIAVSMCLLALIVFVFSCSEPEGGYKTPTPEEIAQYSHHVLIGEVTEILRPDPLYGDMYANSTYGAMVTVQCTYKGGILPGRIQIGGAGFVPGLCFAKDLEEGTHYLLFLYDKNPASEVYEQADTAVSKNKVADYTGICGFEMRYPKEDGWTLKRKICPEATNPGPCSDQTQPNPTTDTDIVTTRMPDATTTTGGASLVTVTSVSVFIFSLLCMIML